MTDQTPRHPLQPLIKSSSGLPRFKENAIVRHLLDHSGIDLNQIARLEFSQDDQEQFAQLIGYSLIGFGTLSYVSDATYAAAAATLEAPEQPFDFAAAYRRGAEETESRLKQAINDAIKEAFND